MGAGRHTGLSPLRRRTAAAYVRKGQHMAAEIRGGGMSGAVALGLWHIGGGVAVRHDYGDSLQPVPENDAVLGDRGRHSRVHALVDADGGADGVRSKRQDPCDRRRASSCGAHVSAVCRDVRAARGAVVLPNGTGKKVRVAVFAKGDAADAAAAAGAEIVGAEDLVAKIQGEGFLDFDVAIAAPNMMGLVGRLGKVLGPRGLMPSPKAGTVTPDVAKAVEEAKAGKIEYRLDKTNIIHCPIGKVSFGAEKLQENYKTLMAAIDKAKPAASKGQYIKSCVVATTMGPGVRINPAKAVIAE